VGLRGGDEEGRAERGEGEEGDVLERGRVGEDREEGE
jgi:hypothetical protein